VNLAGELTFPDVTAPTSHQVYDRQHREPNGIRHGSRARTKGALCALITSSYCLGLRALAIVDSTHE
jgi:hypothetical protein